MYTFLLGKLSDMNDDIDDGRFRAEFREFALRAEKDQSKVNISTLQNLFESGLQFGIFQTRK